MSDVYGEACFSKKKKKKKKRNGYKSAKKEFATTSLSQK